MPGSPPLYRERSVLNASAGEEVSRDATPFAKNPVTTTFGSTSQDTSSTGASRSVDFKRGGDDSEDLQVSPIPMTTAEKKQHPELGKWVYDAERRAYWSEEEKLFYFPANEQFLEPISNMWYDPATAHWYSNVDRAE